MSALLATTTAATALLFGTGPGQDRVRVLDPASLRPVAASPRFPPSVSQVEVSPDGTRIAAGYDRGLLVFDARTGRRVARIRAQTLHRVLSWLTADSIALVKRGKPTTVRIVSVAAREVVHREVLRARLSDTARVGERQVTLNAVRSGDEQTLSVFGADGRLERTVPLPGMTDGELHGGAPGGRALVLADEAPLVYAVDPATGVAEPHALDLGADRAAAGWVEPTTGDMLAVAFFGRPRDGVAILDPATFAVRRTVTPGGLIKGAGEGFVSYDEEGDAPVVVFGPDGAERWRRPDLDVLDVGAFGDRLYAGSGYDDVRVRGFDLVTGRRLRVLRGRASLFEPSAGRVDPPFFGNPAIAED